MKILAVICEYNPFHKGHEYQLKYHRDSLHADGVLCLMSGSFVQRGAPAIFDKWSRARAAVLSGADLVIELPVVYAAQSAMRFAFGGISLLNALGCVDYLSFGSECGDLGLLQSAASIVFSDKFRFLISAEMKNGISYPAARSRVLHSRFPGLQENLIKEPNNILALEYLNAIQCTHSAIKPATLRRNGTFASASQIRDLLEQGKDISGFVPEATSSMDCTPYDQSAYDEIVSYHFRWETPETLRKIADVSEGLENRFLNCARTTFGAGALAEKVKSKRYTRTRIDRIIVNALLGITDSDTALPPQYVRVLAFNGRGTQILNEINKSAKIPVITKAANASSTGREFRRMLDKDLLATDIYSLITKDRRAGLDFIKSPIYVK